MQVGVMPNEGSSHLLCEELRIRGHLLTVRPALHRLYNAAPARAPEGAHGDRPRLSHPRAPRHLRKRSCERADPDCGTGERRGQHAAQGGHSHQTAETRAQHPLRKRPRRLCVLTPFDLNFPFLSRLTSRFFTLPSDRRPGVRHVTLSPGAERPSPAALIRTFLAEPCVILILTRPVIR